MIKLEVNKSDIHCEVKGDSADINCDLLGIIHVIGDILKKVNDMDNERAAIASLVEVYFESEFSDDDAYSTNHVDMSNLTTILNNIRGKDND